MILVPFIESESPRLEVDGRLRELFELVEMKGIDRRRTSAPLTGLTRETVSDISVLEG